MLEMVSITLVVMILLGSGIGAFYGLRSWGKASEQKHIVSSGSVAYKMATKELRAQVSRVIKMIILGVLAVFYLIDWPGQPTRGLVSMVGLMAVALIIALNTVMDYQCDRRIMSQIDREQRFRTQGKPPPSPEGEDRGS